MLPRFTETIAWLALYIGFVVFALTAGAASPLYRAVFIDRTASDWEPGATQSYVPSTVIAGNHSSAYFASGWWAPETDARWGRGARSIIIVQPTRDLPVGSRLQGRIGAMVGGHRPNQTIIVEVNGTEADRLEFSLSDRVKIFDVPLPAPVATGDAVEIAFIVPDAGSPLLLHAGPDFRELGVSFYELTLVPPP